MGMHGFVSSSCGLRIKHDFPSARDAYQDEQRERLQCHLITSVMYVWIEVMRLFAIISMPNRSNTSSMFIPLLSQCVMCRAVCYIFFPTRTIHTVQMNSDMDRRSHKRKDLIYYIRANPLFITAYRNRSRTHYCGCWKCGSKRSVEHGAMCF